MEWIITRGYQIMYKMRRKTMFPIVDSKLYYDILEIGIIMKTFTHNVWHFIDS